MIYDFWHVTRGLAKTKVIRHKFYVKFFFILDLDERITFEQLFRYIVTQRQQQTEEKKEQTITQTYGIFLAKLELFEMELFTPETDLQNSIISHTNKH